MSHFLDSLVCNIAETRHFVATCSLSVFCRQQQYVEAAICSSIDNKIIIFLQLSSGSQHQGIWFAGHNGKDEKLSLLVCKSAVILVKTPQFGCCVKCSSILRAKLCLSDLLDCVGHCCICATVNVSADYINRELMCDSAQ